MRDRKDTTRLELEVFEMESLNIETLNIEELERRLELTSGMLNAMAWGCGCDGCCELDPCILCTCNGYDTCPTYCIIDDCPTYCSVFCTDCIDCPSDVIVPY